MKDEQVKLTQEEITKVLNELDDVMIALAKGPPKAVGKTNDIYNTTKKTTKSSKRRRKMDSLNRERLAVLIPALFGSDDEEIVDRIRTDDEYYQRVESGMREIIDEELSPREKKVLFMNYGLEDGTARSLEEIAQAFGVEQEIIRQLVARAFRNLRHPSASKRIRALL